VLVHVKKRKPIGNIYYLIISQADQIVCTMCKQRESVSKRIVIIDLHTAVTNKVISLHTYTRVLLLAEDHATHIYYEFYLS
jgi:hypothetical protein